MAASWLGTRRVAVIPASVGQPPADFVQQIQRRLFFDLDPINHEDCSLRSYLHIVSYGKALLEADIFPAVQVANQCDINGAINQVPAAAAYTYACVVYPGTCSDWAFWNNPPFPFNPALPAGTTNNLRNWCLCSMGQGLGVWAMEFLHIITNVGDLYLSPPHPGDFDNMACSCGTHPSTWTKLQMGWLDVNWIATAPPTQVGADFNLHAIGLLQPPPPGRVTAVRIPSSVNPTRYFLVEARLRVDQFERQTANPGAYQMSAGIPGEGVVVYEINEAAWPVHLRTNVALGVGSAAFQDQNEQLEVAVVGSIPGGFVVRIKSTENPRCIEIRDQLSEIEDEILTDTGDMGELTGAAKARMGRTIARLNAERARLRAEGTTKHCRLM